jgi:uncharacterized protein YndB with AHSA1/START domain
MSKVTESTITVDQFIAAPPGAAWRALTEPELLARWWAPGDIAAVVGHRFHLQMPGWGAVPCEVLTVNAPSELTYRFNDDWTLSWRLVAEGKGTRLILEHSGFDLDDKRQLDAFERMGRDWLEVVLPRLASVAAELR